LPVSPALGERRRKKLRFKRRNGRKKETSNSGNSTGGDPYFLPKEKTRNGGADRGRPAVLTSKEKREKTGRICKGGKIQPDKKEKQPCRQWIKKGKKTRGNRRRGLCLIHCRTVRASWGEH